MRHLRVSEEKLHAAFARQTPAVSTSGPVPLLALPATTAPSEQRHFLDRPQVSTNRWAQAIASQEVPQEGRSIPAIMQRRPAAPVFRRQQAMPPAVRRSAKPEVA